MASTFGFTKLFPTLQRAVARSCHWYQSKLIRRPYVVKGMTSAGILGFADYLGQKIRGHPVWDKRQTFLMSCYGGLCIAPFCHNWYRFLERLVPIPRAATRGVKLRLAAKRMLLDQLLAAPIFTAGFFVSRGVVAGEDLAGIEEKMKKDYLKVLGAGAVVWPQAQLVNFFFVPLHYRVLYTNMVGLGWSTFTSVVASYDDTANNSLNLNSADVQRFAAMRPFPDLAMRQEQSSAS